MRKIFDLLTRREKRILLVLVIFLLGALCVFLFVGQSQKRSFIRAEQEKSRVENEWRSVQEQMIAQQNEWSLWKEAQEDNQKIHREYLYPDKDALPHMRADLQRILQRADLRASQIQYDYQDFEEESIRLVRFVFTLKGSYSRLKSFLWEVESLPKFLMLEKIDFVEVQVQTGYLTLRIHLIGYQDV